MKRVFRLGYRGFVISAVVLPLAVLTVACADLPGTGTTAVGDMTTETTEGSLTTVEVTTTGPLPTDVTTATTAIPSTTLPPGTTLPPAATTSTTGLSTAEWVVPGGNIRALGFIKNVWVDGGVRYLKIDYAELIEGEAAATAAAIEDGLIAPGETWDAEFYINNDNPLLRTFRISNTAEIYTQFRNHLVDLDGAPCSWADFLSFWGPGPLAEGDSHLPTSPWWIERHGDTIVWIMQMFTP